MRNSTVPQLGETKDGYVLTESGWMPTKPPKKNRTFLKVFLALCAFGLISVIGLPDLMQRASLAAGATRRPFVFYMLAAAVYLAITTLSELALRALQHRLRTHVQEVRL